IDWFPTLAEYCHIDLPKRKIDGKSLVKLIAQKNGQSPHDTFYWKSGGTKDSPQWAVRQGQWKLLHSPAQAKKEELDSNGLFLVNIEKDPAEENNLSGKHPDVVEKLKDLYEKWEAEVDAQ
ncbi:sulfatase/phosphatase domain-containing protein, partial [Olivibacter domesticus]